MSRRLVDVSEALWDLTEQVQFQVIAKATKDFEVVERVTSKIIFPANLQPQPPQKILLRPEGQRTWKWWTLWTRSLLDLDWVLESADGKRFRVMSKSDWNQANYYEYEVTETVVPAL